MTTKARCSVCGEYVLREDMYRSYQMTNWCSPECLAQGRVRRRDEDRKQGVKRSHGVPRKSLNSKLRNYIYERDGSRCRYCTGCNLLEVHHIDYRSQGGLDAKSNLILLCKECHMLVHSSKHRFQPLLRGVIWMHYCEHKRVTAPQLERWLHASKPNNQSEVLPASRPEVQGLQ